MLDITDVCLNDGKSPNTHQRYLASIRLFYKMFIVFYVVKIMYILCTYDLFHILLPLWHTCASMQCMCVCMLLCTALRTLIVSTVYTGHQNDKHYKLILPKCFHTLDNTDVGRRHTIIWCLYNCSHQTPVSYLPWRNSAVIRLIGL